MLLDEQPKPRNDQLDDTKELLWGGRRAPLSRIYGCSLRLTAAQYARGLVSWTPIDGVEIQVGTAPNAQAPKQWTEKLADPAGCPHPIDLQPVFTFKVWLHGQVVVDIPDFWIRLERVSQGVLITRYLHGFGSPPVVLRHLPDYGTYHRLVVDAGSFSWMRMWSSASWASSCGS